MSSFVIRHQKWGVSFMITEWEWRSNDVTSRFALFFTFLVAIGRLHEESCEQRPRHQADNVDVVVQVAPHEPQRQLEDVGVVLEPGDLVGHVGQRFAHLGDQFGSCGHPKKLKVYVFYFCAEITFLRGGSSRSRGTP